MSVEEAKQVLEKERDGRRRTWKEVYQRDHDDTMTQAIVAILTAYEAREAYCKRCKERDDAR